MFLSRQSHTQWGMEYLIDGQWLTIKDMVAMTGIAPGTLNKRLHSKKCVDGMGLFKPVNHHYPTRGLVVYCRKYRIPITK